MLEPDGQSLELDLFVSPVAVTIFFWDCLLRTVNERRDLVFLDISSVYTQPCVPYGRRISRGGAAWIATVMNRIPGEGRGDCQGATFRSHDCTAELHLVVKSFLKACAAAARAYREQETPGPCKGRQSVCR